MKEALWVRNPTKQILSLNLIAKPDLEGLAGLAKHKVKRVTKAGFVNIMIKSFPLTQQKVELVSATGLSIEDIKASSDFHFFLRKGMLEIISETHVVEVEDLEEISEAPVPVVEVAEERILKEEAKTKKEKAPSKSKKDKKGVTLFKKKSKE